MPDPKVPLGPLPSFVWKNTVEPIPGLVQPRLAPEVVADRRKLLRPVPDWVVWLTKNLVHAFMIISVVMCCLITVTFGIYMHPGVIWATHAATIVGSFVNLGLFETVKCVVIACVALVKDETAKRQAEIAARKARLALKAQRLRERSSNPWRRPPDKPPPKALPPLPFLG